MTNMLRAAVQSVSMPSAQVRPSPTAVKGLATIPSSVTAKLVNRVLTVVGTNGDDVIRVTTANNGTDIRVAGKSFRAANVDRIVVAGESGDDEITISSKIRTTTYLYGGDGDDTITGGSGKDFLYGGDGSDYLEPAAGHDVIWGGPGVDIFDETDSGDEWHGGSPSLTYSMNTMEREIVRLTNVERKKVGLPALTIDDSLAKAASYSASSMADLSDTIGLTSAVQHILYGAVRPTPSSRLDSVGFEWSTARENVAGGQRDAAAVVKSWMNSPDHKKNILAKDVDRIGVAVATNSRGVKFFCQVFAAH